MMQRHQLLLSYADRKFANDLDGFHARHGNHEHREGLKSSETGVLALALQTCLSSLVFCIIK